MTVFLTRLTQHGKYLNLRFNVAFSADVVNPRFGLQETHAKHDMDGPFTSSHGPVPNVTRLLYWSQFIHHRAAWHSIPHSPELRTDRSLAGFAGTTQLGLADAEAPARLILTGLTLLAFAPVR